MPLIRRATLQDLAAMQVILEKSPTDWTVEILQDCFSENYLNWVMVCETPVGFLMVKDNRHAWEIMQIVIDPSFQRKGFAKKLLMTVIDQARQESRMLTSDIHLQLEVRSSNRAAIALYQQCGFIEVSIRKKYYHNGEDAILMDLETKNEGS